MAPAVKGDDALPFKMTPVILQQLLTMGLIILVVVAGLAWTIDIKTPTNLLKPSHHSTEKKKL